MTTNLSIIGNFVLKKNHKRAKFFGKELEKYITELNTREYDKRIKVWVIRAGKIVKDLQTDNYNNKYLADDSFTCGVVLQNRAIHLM